MGPSRCGKDESGEYLESTTKLRYGGSTSLYLTPHMARYFGVSEATAYAQRHDNRIAWYEEGNRLRAEDPGVLLDRCYEKGDIGAGIRDPKEVDYAVTIVDKIVWIDRPGCEDPSLEFDLEYCRRAAKGTDCVVETISNRKDINGLYFEWDLRIPTWRAEGWDV